MVHFHAYLTFAVDLFADADQGVLTEQSSRVRGFNRRFIPRLYSSVPEIYALNDQDLEDLVDKSKGDDLISYSRDIPRILNAY